jgi:peptidyl-dipeptidase A
MGSIAPEKPSKHTAKGRKVELRRMMEDATRKVAFQLHLPWKARDPFFQSCKHDTIPLPRQASRGNSGGELGTVDGMTLAHAGPDMDRFFRDKDLEELTRKTYDNMGLEVRDVLAKSDLYERGQEPARLLPVRREGVPL